MYARTVVTLSVFLIFMADSLGLTRGCCRKDESTNNGEGTGVGGAEGTCLAEHNSERAKNGKDNFIADPRLEKAAAGHSEWMQKNDCFEHDCPGETKMLDRVKQAGYPKGSLVGENILCGAGSCSMAMGEWMKSPGHRANILNSKYKQIGCHIRGKYYTCNFGTPSK